MSVAEALMILREFKRGNQPESTKLTQISLIFTGDTVDNAATEIEPDIDAFSG